MKTKPRARNLWLLGAAIVLVLAASAIFFGAGTATRQAKATSPSNNLFALRRANHSRR